MIHGNEMINDSSTKRIFSCDVTSDVARPPIFSRSRPLF